MTKESLVGPVQLAKELGIRPQILYGLIRQGRLKEEILPNGKKGVRRDAALRVLASMRQRRPSGSAKSEAGPEAAVSSPLRRGQIASYTTFRSGDKGGVYRQVVQAVASNDQLTVLRDLRKELAVFRNTTLRDMLSSGTMTLEDPWSLLEIVCEAWSETRPDLASSLKQWMESCNGSVQVHA